VNIAAFVINDDGASGWPHWFASRCGRHEIAELLLAPTEVDVKSKAVVETAIYVDDIQAAETFSRLSSAWGSWASCGQ
jgi:hypothetical protein